VIEEEDLNLVHRSLKLLTGLKENFQETVSASHTMRNVNLTLGIDQADLIKEAIQIQKADLVGNLTAPKENFQETVSASHIMRNVNLTLGIDLADPIKEAIQTQKADLVANLTGPKENFQETVSASLIISLTHQIEHQILEKEIESQDLIKEEIQIQKVARAGNLTDPKGNFQETVRVSPLIRSVDHMLEIGRTELFKEAS
jgi:hypothetical protein